MLFYWVAWIFWVITTFFMKKSETYRLKISVCILVAIILAPYSVRILGFEVNATLIFLYYLTIIQIVKQTKVSVLYTLFSSFIIMMAYASFLLFELYDPVWVILDRTWLLGAILCYLCVLLRQQKWNRAYILVIGMIHGDFIYAMVLQKFGYIYPIGSGSFLNAFAGSLLVLFLWSVTESFQVNMDQHVNIQIRGKQKST